MLLSNLLVYLKKNSLFYSIIYASVVCFGAGLNYTVSCICILSGKKKGKELGGEKKGVNDFNMPVVQLQSCLDIICSLSPCQTQGHVASSFTDAVINAREQRLKRIRQPASGSNLN